MGGIMKDPDVIYSEAPEEIRMLAEEVLKIEKDYILDKRPFGIVDELINIFKRGGN